MGISKTPDVLELKDSDSKITIKLNGANGDINVGGNSASGAVIVRDLAGRAMVRIQKREIKPKPGQIAIGEIFDVTLMGVTERKSIILSSHGEITLRNSAKDKDQIYLDGPNADVWAGGNGESGDVVLFPASATAREAGAGTVHLHGGGGNIWLGGAGQHGNLFLFHSAATNNHDVKQAAIILDAETGDISLQNADCAEEFDISEAEWVEPGTVMVIDQDGKLRPNTEAYDRRVAGVVSGAGNQRPGIVLDKKHSQDHRLPVALVGKVSCKVDAGYSPVGVGDLLTTSPTPGHAMKAGDPLKAFGAVIGKALRPLETGLGLIPILVALQ